MGGGEVNLLVIVSPKDFFESANGPDGNNLVVTAVQIEYWGSDLVQVHSFTSLDFS